MNGIEPIVELSVGRKCCVIEGNYRAIPSLDFVARLFADEGDGVLLSSVLSAAVAILHVAILWLSSSKRSESRCTELSLNSNFLLVLFELTLVGPVSIACDSWSCSSM